MYSVVLATALLAGAETPNFHRHGCHGCHGAYNAFSGCHGCFGGCYGGCHGCYGSYGCFSSCHGCYSSYCSGCYSSYCSGCYSSYCSGCFSSYCSGCFSSGCFGSAGHGCYGGSAAFGAGGGIISGGLVVPSGMGGTGGGANSSGSSNGATQQRLDKLEKAIDRLSDALKKAEKGKGKSRDNDDVSVQDAPARVTVQLPADAQLYVDNVLCTLTSSERSFNTPPLRAGQKYAYTLRVETTGNSQSQQIVLRAGQHVQVNFNATTGVFTIKN